jgi:hypothetical protein
LPVSVPKVFGNITGAGLSDEDELEENSLLSDDEEQLIAENRKGEVRQQTA